MTARKAAILIKSAHQSPVTADLRADEFGAGQKLGVDRIEWVNEIKTALLRKLLKIGTDQIDDGGGVAIESKNALDSLFEDLSRQA